MQECKVCHRINHDTEATCFHCGSRFVEFDAPMADASHNQESPRRYMSQESQRRVAAETPLDIAINAMFSSSDSSSSSSLSSDDITGGGGSFGGGGASGDW